MNVKGVILGVSISLMLITGAYSEMWYVQTFEDLNNGPLAGQDGWTGGATVQDEFSHGDSGQSINVTGNISRVLDEHEGVQYVSFYLMLTEEANMDWKLYMGDVAQNQAAAMGLNPNNETIHIHGGDEQIFASIEPGGWYQLGAVLDFDAKMWNVYFSDMEAPLREGNGFRNAGSESLVNIWLNIWTAPSAGGLYLDDFMIGDGDVIPTSLGPTQAVEPKLKLAALWGGIKTR